MCVSPVQRLVLVCVVAAATIGAQPLWERIGRRGIGAQCDLVGASDGTVHVVEQNYYQYDAEGASVSRTNGFDPPSAACHMCYPPAIDVDSAGGVHVLVRGEGGWDSGYGTRYRYRSPQGDWGDFTDISEPRKRDYHVGIAALDNGAVYAVHSVESNLHFYSVAPGQEGYLGSISNVCHAEGGLLVRDDGENVYVATARKGGYLRIFAAPAGDNFVSRLESNLIFSNSECLLVDMDAHPGGVLDVAIGHNAEKVDFLRMTAAGTDIVARKTVLSNLGFWVFDAGHGVVASSDDLSTIVVVAQRGQEGDAKETLEWTYSEDNGNTFSTPAAVPGAARMTFGYERLMPRLDYAGDRFFLMFPNDEDGGLDLWTCTFGGVAGVRSAEVSALSRGGQGRASVVAAGLGDGMQHLSPLVQYHDICGRRILSRAASQPTRVLVGVPVK